MDVVNHGLARAIWEGAKAMWRSRRESQAKRPTGFVRGRALGVVGGVFLALTALTACGDTGEFREPSASSSISAEDAQQYCEPGHGKVQRLDFVETVVLRDPDTQAPQAVATVGGQFCGEEAFRGWIAVVAGPNASRDSRIVVKLASSGGGSFDLGTFPAAPDDPKETDDPKEIAGTFESGRPSNLPGASSTDYILSVDMEAVARPGQNIGDPPPDDTHTSVSHPRGWLGQSGHFVEGTSDLTDARARARVLAAAQDAGRHHGLRR